MLPIQLTRRVRRAALLAALPAAVAAAALPAAAGASVAGVDPVNRTLHYVDGGRNDRHGLSFAAVDGAVVIRDTVPIDRLFSNRECESETPQRMRCSLASVSAVQVHFGSGDDSFTSYLDVPTVVFGGGGSDEYVGGVAAGTSRVDFSGGSGFDRALYAAATAGVTVTKDEVRNDGRTNLDRDLIRADVEHLTGSRFADTLSASDGEFSERLEGGAGADRLFGNGGPDLFLADPVADGGDLMVGGAGDDTATYGKRTLPVTLTLSHGGADDGEAGERDELREIERAQGGAAGDTLVALPDGSGRVALLGLGGADTIEGGRSDDTINGGPGGDTVRANGGSDIVQARDGGTQDSVSCGSELDTVDFEAGIDLVSGDCENVERLGALRLTPAAARAAAGRAVRIDLGWKHPRSWRRLARMVLRVTDAGAPVGEVAVDPRKRRLAGSGAIRVVGRASRVTRDGKWARARLALRLHPSLRGRALGLEVEAIDTRGRRQLESRAGTLLAR